VEHITTTPYYPQDSLAERVNRNLKSALKIFHHQTQNAWDEDLSWLIIVFNTAMHESTQATPDSFLGREMRCPLGVRWDLSPVNSGQVNSTDRCFWSQTYHNLKLASRKVSQRYKQDHKPHRFRVGDTVRYRLKLFSSKAWDVSAKFLLRCSEPIVIVKAVPPNVVLLTNPDTGVITRRAHDSQLKHV
jgi:hypothetical protein